jgi:DNA polymerase III subunit alpha
MADTSTPTPASLSKPTFVHLKVHSAYSLLEGALPIPTLAKLAEKMAMPALALTDTNNMFGCLEFADKAAGTGIQPITGISLAVDCRDPGQAKSLAASSAPVLQKPNWDGLIALYAMNAEGYDNLMLLASMAHLKTGDTETPHIKLADLLAHDAGLIVLTGGPDGPINCPLIDGHPEVAEKRLVALQQAFGDRLYIELQRHNTANEAAAEPRLLDFAYTLGIPIVATNECYFAKRADYEAHDVLLCIAEGRYISEDDRRRVTPEHYFKTAEEMAKLFADLPEALDNTLEIARRCAYRIKGRKPILPAFVKTAEGASEAEREAAEAGELNRQAEDGLKVRLDTHGLSPGFTREDYEKRLAYELDVIATMKFPGYFLIVADFIKWSKSHDIPVGPGRGSGAGSLVAWALTITDLDPLRFGLLFERFLNPERVSMPDFDIDFCQDRREETINYVQQKYGADRVAQIITHGKLQARAVLRDVGRVLQMSFGQVSRLSALVPNNPANPVTLRQAIDGEPKLQEEAKNDEGVARLLEISERLEGLYRHASTHAAGVVIGDRPLDRLVPMYRDPKSNFAITQFNMKLVEAAGLVKFDFLGLKTLTVLRKAVDLIKAGRGITVELEKLEIGGTDPLVLAAYELLAKADTVGVFQLESTGMREALKRLKPDRFEDIIAMVALYRPGPMDNIPTYIHRKHGEEPIEYPHAMLKPILEETYGVIIYQEQVIQIAQVMGGYTLGQADLLRRAMGKKDKNEMARQQAKFVDGAKANGVKEKEAVGIFELVDKFAGYGFNKSHAAAYALVSYHTAYLKANYREEFLAASMSLDIANTDKLAMFANEARKPTELKGVKKPGIIVKTPCVNASGVDFSVEPPKSASEAGAIRYSMAALKSMGRAAVESIVAERDKSGPYKDLADFARRMDAHAVNKRGLETLAAGGAFDTLEPNRALVHANVDKLMGLAKRLADDNASGIVDMFGGGSGGSKLDMKPAKMWTPTERLAEEFKAIGFYLSGHPLDQYASVLGKLGATPYAVFEPKAGLTAMAGRLAAIVVSARERRSQKGNKFAFAMFSDATAQFEAVIFSDTLAKCGDLLEPGTPVLLSVEAERDGETVKLRVGNIEKLDAAAANIQSGIKIVLDDRLVKSKKAKLVELFAMFKPATGRGGSTVEMWLRLYDVDREIKFDMPGKFEISPTDRGIISTVPGVLEVVET